MITLQDNKLGAEAYAALVDARKKHYQSYIDRKKQVQDKFPNMSDADARWALRRFITGHGLVKPTEKNLIKRIASVQNMIRYSSDMIRSYDCGAQDAAMYAQEERAIKLNLYLEALGHLRGHAIRVWDNYIIEKTYEKGFACRNNASYQASNGKTHWLIVQRVIALISEEEERSTGYDTIGTKFLRKGKPVVFGVSPLCGCTQGQMSGGVVSGDPVVTCEKCEAATARRGA